jgi:cell fate (sporulation/competence/biofilm development) regulator YlbF (YheA/YmcA/DUF963 family)
MKKSQQFNLGGAKSPEEIQAVFQQQKAREEIIRKDPDTILCARIKIKHAQFMAGLQSLRDKIETQIAKSGRSDALVTLVQKYIERIHDYQKIFHAEQAELDLIKKIRRDNIFPFGKALEDETIEINKRIKAAELPADKKILKKALLALKEYAKEMRQLEKNADNIDLSKSGLAVVQEDVKDLEQKYKRLLSAIAKKNEVFFGRLAKARKLKKAKLMAAAGGTPDNFIKETMARIKTYLTQYRKDMKDFDHHFIEAKHVIHDFKVPHHDKKSLGLFKSLPQDEVTARLAANPNAQKLMEKIKSLQTNLQAVKRKGDKIAEKIAQRANREVLAEINYSLRSKRQTLKAQFSDTVQLAQQLKSIIINTVSEYSNSLPASQRTPALNEELAELTTTLTTGSMTTVITGINELLGEKKSDKYAPRFLEIIRHELNKHFERLPFEFNSAGLLVHNGGKTDKLIAKHSALEVLKEKDSLAYDLINTNISSESKQMLKELQKCLASYKNLYGKELARSGEAYDTSIKLR